MLIKNIIDCLETIAPISYQENYDNCGLLVGDSSIECTGVLCTLDCTEEVVLEAKLKNCNLIVAHHPIIFSGLKKITGKNYVEKTVIAAIKNDIAIYAIHTNLDNVYKGVNKIIADKIGLINTSILQPKSGLLSKFVVYVPLNYVEQIREVIFANGGGVISNYEECSFAADGVGTFKATENANPFVGKLGERHYEKEAKLEVIIPHFLQNAILDAVKKVHPYEEVAYEIIALQNEYNEIGSGMIGELEVGQNEIDFCKYLAHVFGLQIIRHTPFLNKPIKKVALCGGSGSFLIKNAIAAKADIYITADVKYHEFFDAEKKMVIADIGHWETEQFTPELIMDVIKQKFPTFAVQKSEVDTNPVKVFMV